MSKKKSNEVVVRDGIYIPIKLLPYGINDSLDAYTKHMFEDTICNNCSYKPDRPSAMCEECELEGYKGSICTAKTHNTSTQKYLKVPTGDKRMIEDKLGIDMKSLKFRDIRCKSKFKYKWKFLGKLRDYQEDVQKKWLKYGYGLVKSAPRTGKTVMGIANAIKQGKRTIILADQKDFLDGFYETIEALTNANDIQEIKGKKIFGFLEKEEDYFNYDIGLLTYQSLISSNGKKRRKWINKNFSILIIDEVHAANATEFSKVISKLRMRHKYGLTATPKRKDGREFLMEQLVGPITAATTVKALTPTLYCHKLDTGKLKGNFTGRPGFTRLIGALATNKKRNDTLVKYALHDVSKGHCLSIPCMRKEQVTYLVNELNRRAGKVIAAEFVGGAKAKGIRKQVIDDARSRKIKVVVGIRSLMQRGINIPSWSCHYYQMPMSNESNWEQESNRVCTPGDSKKRDPIIRMFVDPQVSMSLGCWRTTIRFSKIQGHKFSDSAIEVIQDLGTGRQSYHKEDFCYDVDQSGPKSISYGKKKPVQKRTGGTLFDAGMTL